MKQRYICAFAVIMITVVILSSRCSAFDSARHISYMGIPEITYEDIKNIENISKEFKSFIYGVNITTESYITDDGKIEGFTRLLCERLTELIGIEFIPKDLTWDELITKLDSKEIDFTGELTPTAERLSKYYMTDAIVQRMIKIFTNSKVENLSLIAEERKIRCAFLEGSNTYALAKDKWIYPFEPVFLPDEDEIAKQLESGKVDAFVEECIEEAYFAKHDFIKTEDFYPLSYSPVSITTKNPKLAPIINIIQKYLSHGGAYELTVLYNQGTKDYNKHKLISHLTEEEKEYIKAHSTPGNAIALGAEFDNYPVSFYNEKENEFQGMAIDILKEITEITGLLIEIKSNEYTSWSEILYNLESGEYSLVTELIPTENRKTRFLWTENPFCSNFYAMLSRTDFPYIDINQSLYLNIGIVEDSAYADVFKDWYPSSVKTKYYKLTTDAFLALERKEIDLLMASQNQLLHYTNYMEKPGFKTNIVFNSASDTYFGFNKNEKVLCSIINKAQEYVSLYNISEHWKRRVFDYKSKMLGDVMPYLVVFSIILTIVLFAVLSLFMKNRSLNNNLQLLVTVRTKELENTVQKLESANRAKNEFLAKISHEIRTPMNAIVGMSELVLRENIPVAAHEDVIAIKHASANLLSIINDILDLSKIESGKLETIPDEYNILSIINDVINIIRIRIMEKPILFVSFVDSNLPSQLIGDEIRIRQIMLNILSNAAKYTKEGHISLTIDSEEIDENSVTVKIEVSDTGIGIKKEDIPNLFGEFFQADALRNKGIEGIGLGLAITKNLCKTMGGSITVESEYGKGSIFKVSLPQKICSGEKFAHVENPEKINILLYETRKVYAESIVRSVNNLGMNYKRAANLSDFIEELNKNTYDFAFLPAYIYDNAKSDIERYEINSKIVLIAEHGRVESGNVKTILMPLHTLSIANIINGIDDESAFSDNNKDKYARFTAPTARILIVDDINTNLRVAEGLMTPYKMRIDSCESGMKAIELAESNLYDVIFMDHMMPIMNGIEATQAIRKISSPQHNSAPIIALTANAVSGMKEMFLSNGFNDFLSKPIEMKKLNEILEKWVPKEKKEKYIARTKEKMTEETILEIAGINIESGLLMAGKDENNYLKVLSVFYKDGNDKIIEIQNCCENNIKLYTTHVHALKSALASIGAHELSQYAQSLELAGIGEDTAFIKNNNDKFLKELSILLSNIKLALSQNNATENDSSEKIMLSESVKGKLYELIEAIKIMDTITTDKIVNELSEKHFNNKTKETLEQISQHILFCDYDDAVEKINLLIEQ